MSAKIIDSKRYKTITKTQLEKKRRQNQYEIKSQKSSVKRNNKNTLNDNNSFISNLRIKKHREKKIEQEMLLYSRPQRTVLKEPKDRIYIPKSFIIICSCLCAVFLIYISARIMLNNNEDTTTVFENNEETKTNVSIPLETNYDLKIGLNSIDTTDINKSHNLIINDLYKKISYSLVKIENNYDIKYQLAKNIEKLNDTSYKVVLNPDYKIQVEDVIYSVEKIRTYGKENMYYDRIDKIASIDTTEDKNTFILNIKESNPYYVYMLDFPIEDKDGKINSGFNIDYIQNGILFKSTNKDIVPSLSSISITNYGSIDESVNMFTSGKIDMFFASSNNDMQLIGKNDYNVKKYKDGETLFLFGNKDSQIFAIPEIRNALMYSLNREEIVKNSDNNFIELIDLPFIYSSIKYKYDIVGAQNIMSSNGWNKNGYGVFEKNINGKYNSASLRLLVNSQDENKLNVANNIKNMAQNAGINIEIDALNQEEINQIIEAKDYDLVLASVYLNETPDINFLKEYLNINDVTNQAFIQVEQSSVEQLDKNIQNLQFVLSEQVACIGIYARNINLVYQKNIYGFDNINYMTIFNNINNIGKKIE